MASFFDIYNQFLSLFPSQLHGLISIVVAVLLVVAVVKVLQRNFVYLILLIVLLPASIPVLQNVWNMIVHVLKYLIGQR